VGGEMKCATCQGELLRQFGAGLLQVIWKDLKGKWQTAHYCTPCAKANGDLQDERGRKADEQAKRSGV
jgi:hypothetical protein